MKDKYTGKVAATVIDKGEKQKFLVAKRTDGHGWEFPGGKHEKGETLLQTAEREIMEELKLEVRAFEVAKEYSYMSGKFEIIPVYAKPLIEYPEDELKLTEHSEVRWIKPEKLDSYDLDLGIEKKCLEAFDLL